MLGKVPTVGIGVRGGHRPAMAGGGGPRSVASMRVRPWAWGRGARGVRSGMAHAGPRSVASMDVGEGRGAHGGPTCGGGERARSADSWRGRSHRCT